MQQMTEAEARAKIVMFLDPSTEPKISAAELDILVSMGKRQDINGVEPQDSSWTPTYSVYYSIAQGWLLKSTRLTNRYLFMDQGKMFSRQQYYDHCVKNAQRFAAKAGIMGLKLTPDNALTLNTIPNNAIDAYH